jgi:hypothetical protein
MPDSIRFKPWLITAIMLSVLAGLIVFTPWFIGEVRGSATSSDFEASYPLTVSQRF